MALDLGGGASQAVEWLERGQLGAETVEFSEGDFRSDIADQRVLREGAAAESTDSHIEAATAGIVSSGDFGRGVVRARVQMNADFYRVVDGVEDGGD